MAPAASSTPTTVGGSMCQRARKLRPNSSGSTNFERFKQHILTVNEEEDILRKIRNVMITEPGVVYVKATSETLSCATICLPVQNYEPTIYKGLFDIVSMVGSFVQFKYGILRGKKGRMSTTLLYPNGNLFSDRVEGPMIAATPVQDILKKIMKVATIEPGVVFVNATSGTLSLTTICHHAQHGEHTIYEFEIVSMVGTFVPFKDGILSGKNVRMSTTFVPVEIYSVVE
ncbi:AT-hook motif nuclear-localized protein 9-like isoform X2 [Andrographis paniculata]|uniref:AT-hook motif nuclear-localized protein 9-like isoform X2 n=1 Tax=Andrographis paniculata TaxID=175694 RepID=UPI0021E7D9EB|nr:AT-hook motif nuclear-localized protein 9-like isoform X2 [Andrographis paniculata]